MPAGALGPKYKSIEPSAFGLRLSYDEWAASPLGLWSMERVTLSYRVKPADTTRERGRVDG